MFLYNYSEYYPLEISQIISQDGEVIYDRGKRKKAYCYIDLNTQENDEI